MHKIGEWYGNDVGCFEVMRVGGEGIAPVPVFTVHRVSREIAMLLTRKLSDMVSPGQTYLMRAHESACQCQGHMQLEDSLLFPIRSTAYYEQLVLESKQAGPAAPSSN
jgi:hypothetical protein